MNCVALNNISIVLAASLWFFNYLCIRLSVIKRKLFDMVRFRTNFIQNRKVFVWCVVSYESGLFRSKYLSSFLTVAEVYFGCWFVVHWVVQIACRCINEIVLHYAGSVANVISEIWALVRINFASGQEMLFWVTWLDKSTGIHERILDICRWTFQLFFCFVLNKATCLYTVITGSDIFLVLNFRNNFQFMLILEGHDEIEDDFELGLKFFELNEKSMIFIVSFRL